MSEIEATKNFFKKVGISQFEAVRISLSDFNTLLRFAQELWFEPVTKADILKSGLYGHVLSTPIYVSREVSESFFNIRKDNVWSSAIPMLVFEKAGMERVMKTKSFW